MIQPHTLAARLTSRDRSLLRAIWDFRVLTSHQIAEAYFDSSDAARKRLLTLAQIGALERFQPNLPVGAGTAPFHYVLGPNGATVLAAEDGIEPGQLGYRRDRVLAIAYSSRLAHTVGVNGVATSLIHAARRGPSGQLTAWWPEHRCTKVWGDTARPDAYGRWSDDDGMLDFFLEYDTGTEPLGRVAAKLDDYARLTEATGIVTPVLFLVATERREANLRERLLQQPAHMFVPVATACRSSLAGSPDGGLAGGLWLPTDSPAPRRRLGALAQTWPDIGPSHQPATDVPQEEEGTCSPS
ncbi:replication-relaxation family protein [Nonomuraea sp. NN258]|uniref:replication-relaxation family protein n=1 Tax=Nonomuraea antri TaxID=2730852 RepID=UPI0015697CE1|nr:replication-relaxation family protein [Nonomuraea antri]NRQ38784.1 replication-relaxation family protein [Nonomuraea antri]